LPNRTIGVEIGVVRRLLSILLLAVFGLPIATPLFALSGSQDSVLPACCRKGGKHHCMSMAQHNQLAGDGSQWTAPVDRCPYCPASVAVSHVDHLALTASQVIFAGVVSHPAVHAQTESKRRISRDRSRQKRGPPSIVQS
jgi:hypothetical protein